MEASAATGVGIKALQGIKAIGACSLNTVFEYTAKINMRKRKPSFLKKINRRNRIFVMGDCLDNVMFQ
jgi:hypothetical protein